MAADARPAVVLLSGGLDSATVLALACEAGFTCHALSIDYGQRHRVELAAAAHVAKAQGAREHKIVRVDLSAIGGSALTDTTIDVPDAGGPGIPVTYVPARNTVFLSVALGYAETLGARHIFIGANAVDYSGYPDCRPAFIDAFERLANVATKAAVDGHTMHIEAPLLHLSKAQIVSAGARLGVDYAHTISCYQPDDSGAACATCDACLLRRDGFAAAGLADLTKYVAS